MFQRKIICNEGGAQVYLCLTKMCDARSEAFLRGIPARRKINKKRSPHKIDLYGARREALFHRMYESAYFSGKLTFGINSAKVYTSYLS